MLDSLRLVTAVGADVREDLPELKLIIYRGSTVCCFLLVNKNETKIVSNDVLWSVDGIFVKILSLALLLVLSHYIPSNP